MNQLREVIVNAITNNSMEQKEYKCRYCNKSFRKESTLSAHICEPKRRAQQESEVSVQLGLQAYLRFYELTQGSAKFKNYQDFSESPYYNAFVKFGRHIVNIRAINVKGFINHVIESNKKLDHWCKDSIYHEFLFNHLRKENAQDALERSIKTMEDWAEKNNSVFAHYFLYGNTNRIVQHITTGRISPWAVYNCESGIAMLDKLSPEQVELVFSYIDPSFWKRKFVDYYADAEWAKQVLMEAGL